MNGRLRHNYEVERLGMEPDVPAALVPFGRRVNLNVNRVLREYIPRSSDEACAFSQMAIHEIDGFLNRVANPDEFLNSKTMQKWMGRLGLVCGGNMTPRNRSEFDAAVFNLQNDLKQLPKTVKAKRTKKMAEAQALLDTVPGHNIQVVGETKDGAVVCAANMSAGALESGAVSELKQEISQPGNIIEIPAPKPRKPRAKKAVVVDTDIPL